MLTCMLLECCEPVASMHTLQSVNLPERSAEQVECCKLAAFSIALAGAWRRWLPLSEGLQKMLNCQLPQHAQCTVEWALADSPDHDS